MDWAFVFSAVNLLAVLAWIALVFLPRHAALLSGILYAGVGMLCVVYASGLIGVLSGLVPNDGGVGADFSTIEGVRAIFGNDAGVTIGWTHYLAFDLFVGLWIARDADAKSFSRVLQAPILFLTLMGGPVGLLIWLVVREPTARKNGRWA